MNNWQAQEVRTGRRGAARFVPTGAQPRALGGVHPVSGGAGRAAFRRGGCGRRAHRLAALHRRRACTASDSANPPIWTNYGIRLHVIWDQSEYDLRCEWGMAGVQDAGAGQRCADRDRRAGILDRRRYRRRAGRVRVAVSLAGQFRRGIRPVEGRAAGLVPVSRRLLAVAAILSVTARAGAPSCCRRRTAAPFA